MERILVVDDDPQIIELVVDLVRLSGTFEIEAAQSVEAAKLAVMNSSRNFTMFVVDIQMPSVSGVEFVEFLRLTKDYRNTPIIMLTAMSSSSFVDKAFIAGATDYVTKPFKPLELITRIRLASEYQSPRRTKADHPVLRDPRFLGELDETAFIGLEIDRFVECFVLENYVLRLSGLEKFTTKLASFRIAGEREFLSVKGNRFRSEALTKMAVAFSRLTEMDNCLFSYIGHGGFLAVSRSLDSQRFRAILDEMNIELKSYLCDETSTLHGQPWVQFGKHVQLAKFTKNATLRSLHCAKIFALEGRRSNKVEELTDGKPAGPEANICVKAELNVYQELLTSFLHERNVSDGACIAP